MTVLEKNKGASVESRTESKESKKQAKAHPYQITMRVANKRGVLAKIALLVSERGLGIESLNFSTSKGNISIIHLSLRGQRGQMQGLMNDAQKIAEIKGISLSAT